VNVGVLKEREDEAKALLASEKAKAAATLAAAVALQEQAIADLNNVEERYSLA
jgi:hypothetical protein